MGSLPIVGLVSITPLALGGTSCAGGAAGHGEAFARVMAGGTGTASASASASASAKASASASASAKASASASASASAKGAHHQEHRRSRDDDDRDALDPSARHAAQLAPPAASPTASAAAPEAPASAIAHASLESLLPGLVRRVAWTQGDGKKRAMRVEIGEGGLAGGALLVQAEDGRVRVRLDAPAHVDAEAWRARIAERLAKRGIDVDAIEIG